MSTKKPKVLLIDDDYSLTNMYTLKFSIDGHCEIFVADAPGKGMEMAENIHPDLILLDLVLPKTENLTITLNKEVGFHLLEIFKSNPKTKDIPVIILTNLDETTKGNFEKAKKLGALDYWVKAHYQPAEVVEKVKSILQMK